jgi:hypothetical protein
MAQLTIQPNSVTAGNGDGVIIEHLATTNFGSDKNASITSPAGQEVRGLFKLDFSALPSGVVIDSAIFTLAQLSEAGGVGDLVTLNRMTQTGYIEDQATWNEYASSVGWGTVGGDFTTDDQAQAEGVSGAGDLSFTVTNQVTYARNNTSDIAYFILLPSPGLTTTESIDVGFRERLSAADRPKLVIDYTDSNGTVTLPQLNIQGGSGASGVFSFPLISLEAGQLGGYISLPQLTTSIESHLPVNATVTLPQLSFNAISALHMDVAFTLPQFTTGFSGHQDANIATTFPVVSLSAAGSFDDSASLTLPQLSLSATGNALRGNYTTSLPHLTLSATAFSGTSEGTTLTLPAFTLSIRTGLTNSISLPQYTLAASGENGIVSTYDKSLPRMTVNVKATQQSRGTFDVSLPVFTLDGDTKTGAISSASTRNLPIFRLGASGFVGGVPGDLDLSFPAFELSVLGYQSLSSTVVQSLQMLTLDAYAESYTNRII